MVKNQISYHARDKRQGAGVIPHGDKFVTSGQVSAEADVSCNVCRGVDEVVGPAFPMNGGLKWVG